MQVVDPPHFFWRLNSLNVKVDYDWLLAASHEHTLERLVSAGVDLLMRNKWRNIDEVAGPGFGGKLEMIAPTHSSLAFGDIDHALELAVMMSPGLCVGVNAYSSCPKL